MDPIELPSKRKHWSPQEDEAIRELVGRYTDCKWTEISKKLQTDYNLIGRTGKQCRERWFNHLSPSINKDPWTIKEQTILFSKHKELGNYWANIMVYLPGRSENAVKNQFYSLLRRQYRKFKGCEPTRANLKSYGSVLSNQILSYLKGKGGREVEIKAPRRVLKREEKDKTIDDMVPVEPQSEHSTVLDEHDFFFPMLDDN